MFKWFWTIISLGAPDYMVDFAIMKANKPITTPNFHLYITVRFETVSPAFRACDFTMDAARSLRQWRQKLIVHIQTEQDTPSWSRIVG